MPEKFPPQTWPEGAVPTTTQLREWIPTFGPEHDARIAADMIVGMLAQEKRQHAQTRYTLELRTEAVRKYRNRMKRYRLAWLSARRRWGAVGPLSDSLVAELERVRGR